MTNRMNTAIAAAPRTIAVCSCEDTMTIDGPAIASGCRGATVVTARHLCRSELATFRRLAATAGDLVVACTQEAALFEDVADAAASPARLAFVNIRETAGWSSDGAAAAPKMAALIAAVGVPTPPAKAHAMTSEGVTLIYGPAAAALTLAARLAGRLDVTVVLTDATDAVPPRRATYPVRLGRIASLTGHLGAFEITLDGFAEPAASSRAAFVFGSKRNGARSKADIVIDVSGGAALVTAPDLRHGYLRCQPEDAAGLERLAAKAADLVGTFDTERFVAFDGELCAHSRSRIVGCTRCLDVCPAGAIRPAGNAVAIDPALCGGCGQCAAVCPTGAVAYDLPPADVLMARIRASLTAYREAGGVNAVLMLHGETHGCDLIDAASRFGDGLPAAVIPLAVNEVGQIGVEQMAAALAYGAAAVVLLTRAKPLHDETGTQRTVDLVRAIATGLGFAADAVSILAADDPDVMVEALRRLTGGPLDRSGAATAAGDYRRPIAVTAPATFAAIGRKRDILATALAELHRVAPAPVDRIALPAGSPFGRVVVDDTGCTLCLACVSTCPTHALGDDKERPRLTFDESQCVQCGLCAATCPEKVITLEPRLDFTAFTAGAVTLRQEAPFCCIACGTAFGVKSTVEKIAAKLAEKHWMFSGANSERLDLIRMCDTCRIEAVTNKGFDPYAGTPRAPAKTSDDYLREREAAMLAKIASGEA